MKVDTYNDINGYLAHLSDTSTEGVEDIAELNRRNTGTEGAIATDVPASPSGQVFLRISNIYATY